MREKIAGFILIFVFSMVAVFGSSGKAEAATKYITVNSFAQALADEAGLTYELGKSGAVTALQNVGIIKDGDFSDYDKDLTRGDMLVLLNRADEYVNHDTIEEWRTDMTIEKRISDIKTVSTSKRTDIAKGYLKGFMKGYSNGNYITNRNLKLKSEVTKSGALSSLKLIKDKSLRAKISPDGQLIRTTNLPKYAKNYPYILESFPNAYYDWKFRYEGQVMTNPETMISVPLKKIEEYAAPVDIDKIKDFDNFKEVKAEYLDEWVDKVRTYMECVFNVDYRTIDDEWVNKLLSTDYGYNDESLKKRTKEDIMRYVTEMKKNKTVVESAMIAVDGSSLYFVYGSYVLRVYVKYRIMSSKVKPGADADTLIYENPYGKILYTRYPIVSLNNYIIGHWKESYFDIEMSWVYKKEPSNIGVYEAVLDELLYEKRRVE